MRRVLCMLFAAAYLSGQTFTGNITGVVTDPNQAAVGGAEITLTNVNTGEVRKFVSSEIGAYSFSQLLPGSYTLAVTKQGFREYRQAGIELGTSQTARIDVQLALGQVSESIEVTAAAPLVDSQTANQTESLDSEMVEELPLIARNPFGLVLAMAGVSQQNEFTGGPDQNWTRLSINGGRENSAQVLIDGIPASAGDWGGLIATPGVSSVLELQVTRNAYDVVNGRSGGGIISITTRGASPRYHGSVFHSLQNDNLNANSFFNNFNGRPKTESKRNQFGASVGGPIWKKKQLSGFFSYEALRETSPNSRTATLPTELERRGDFSETRNANGNLRVIHDPFALQPDPARANQFLRTPFPGNVIPASRMDPVGKNIMEMIVPLPNRPGNGLAHTNNYFETGNRKTVNNRYDARVDWARNVYHTLYGQVTMAWQNQRFAEFWNKYAESNQNSINPRFQVKVGNNIMFSPTLIANITLGSARWNEQQYSKGYGFDYTSIGFSPFLARQIDVATPPEITLSGLNGAVFGFPRYLSAVRLVHNAQANATKEFQSHSVKFGWSLDVSMLNNSDANSAFFRFDSSFTSGPSWDGRNTAMGFAPASLLLGTGLSGRAPRSARLATADKSWGFYVQDSWRATRRLTINYGIRYEIQQARTERFNRMNYFDPEAPNPIGEKVGMPGLKGALRFVEPGARSPWKTPLTDFAPRIGIAYRITPKLVMRTGYGIYYSRSVTAPAATSTLGYSNDTAWVTTGDGGRTPLNLLSNPFPDGIAEAIGNSQGLLTRVGDSVTGFLNHRPTPYVQQYSFDLQFEVSRDTMGEIGYSGSQGRKLSYGFPFRLNQLPDSALAIGEPLRELVPNPFYNIAGGAIGSRAMVERRQLLRPYPQFDQIEMRDMPGAGSSFNALNARITRRLAKGMTVIATYRWSKAIDNASETISFGTNDRGRNFNNMRLDRSISLHDIPHSLGVTYLYTFPVGRGQRFLNAMPRVLDAAIGGWRFSGIYKFDTGYPLNFDAPDFTYSMGGSQYPNISDRKQLRLEKQDRLHWFNTAVFSQAEPYTFGNAPRWTGEVRTATQNNWNIGIMKYFTPSEKVKLQLRADMFNAFNRARFATPVTDVTTRTFGEVNSTRGQPRIVQFGLKMMF